MTDTTIIASHLNPSREFTLDQRDVRRLCPVVDPDGHGLELTGPLSGPLLFPRSTAEHLVDCMLQIISELEHETR